MAKLAAGKEEQKPLEEADKNAILGCIIVVQYDIDSLFFELNKQSLRQGSAVDSCKTLLLEYTLYIGSL